jgi:hypothetical protein
MGGKSLEDRVTELELRMAKLEKVQEKLPWCPHEGCGYLLMGCEGGKPGEHPWHMQCWRCGSWFNVEPDPFDVKPASRNFRELKLDDEFFHRRRK